MQDNKNEGRRRSGVKRRRRRRLSKLAYTLILITVFLCTAVIFAAVFFKVEIIKVTGQSIYSSQQITDASGISKGTNLLRINKAEVSKKIITALPYIKSVKIKLCPATAVDIEVEKDSPAYIFKTTSGYILADSTFKILGTKGRTYVCGNMPIITGAKLEQSNPGYPVKFKDKSMLAEIGNIITALKSAQIDKITSIDITNNYELAATYDGRIKIILGTSLGAEKKLKDASVIIKSKLASTDKGTLDVSAEEKRYIFSPS